MRGVSDETSLQVQRLRQRSDGTARQENHHTDRCRDTSEFGHPEGEQQSVATCLKWLEVDQCDDPAVGVVRDECPIVPMVDIDIGETWWAREQPEGHGGVSSHGHVAG